MVQIGHFANDSCSESTLVTAVEHNMAHDPNTSRISTESCRAELATAVSMVNIYTLNTTLKSMTNATPTSAYRAGRAEEYYQPEATHVLWHH